MAHPQRGFPDFPAKDGVGGELGVVDPQGRGQWAGARPRLLLVVVVGRWVLGMQAQRVTGYHSCPQFSCGGGDSTLTHNPAARTSCVSLEEGTYGVWAGLSRQEGERRASQARELPSAGVGAEALFSTALEVGTWGPFTKRKRAQGGSGQGGNLGMWILVQRCGHTISRLLCAQRGDQNPGWERRGCLEERSGAPGPEEQGARSGGRPSSLPAAPCVRMGRGRAHPQAVG